MRGRKTITSYRHPWRQIFSITVARLGPPGRGSRWAPHRQPDNPEATLGAWLSQKRPGSAKQHLPVAPSVPKPSLAPVREVALLSSGSKCRDGPLVPGTRPSTFPLLGCMPLIHELLGGRGEGAATSVNHVWTLFSFKNSTGNNQKCLKLKYRRKFNAITFR